MPTVIWKGDCMLTRFTIYLFLNSFVLNFVFVFSNENFPIKGNDQSNEVMESILQQDIKSIEFNITINRGNRSSSLILQDEKFCNCDDDTENSVKNSFPYLLSVKKNRHLPPNPIPGVSDECTDILTQYSLSVANFTNCLVMNARPITLCENCMDSYLDFQYWFQNISSGSGYDCDEQLLNCDHLLVVQTTYKQAEQLWDDAKCINCYTKDFIGKPTLCNETLEFYKLLNVVTDCINITMFQFDEDPVHGNNSEVCSQCEEIYLQLNKYYEEMNTIFNNRLCMDVVDAMNITRHAWSSKFLCNRISIKSIGALLTSAAFLLLPVIYYCGNRIAGVAKDTKLVQQKRMSFVHASYSSVNLQR